MAAKIEPVKAKFQVVRNVVVHGNAVYTVDANPNWVEGVNLIRISLRLAGSYSVTTIEIDPNHEFETLIVD